MLVAGTAQTPASLSRVAPGVCVCVCFCSLGGSLKAEMAPNGVVHGLSSLSVPTEGRKKKKKGTMRGDGAKAARRAAGSS